MNFQELSDRFDVAYNNIMSNAAPGLNEYEKSVFLTKAQLEITKNYFNARGNKYGEGFDQSPKRQIDFSMLMQSVKLTKTSSSEGTYDVRGEHYNYPDNILAIVNESLVLKEEGTYHVRQVVPISFEEYSRLMSKPFKEPLKNQAWRLITGVSSDNLSIAEVIPNNNDRKITDRYLQVRYVRRPRPIIVADLDQTVGDVTIDGEYKARTSELDPSIHEEILQRAVELAKASYASDQSGQAQLQNQMTIGQRSE